jgi:hypothetical protein
VNAIGGRQDWQVTAERQWNSDWNPVWQVETGRFEGGWTVEVAIPFTSLRFRPGERQVWGFNRVRLTEGAFTSHLAGARITYTMTPTMFASALGQYRSAGRLVATNARLRWEYRPGSELFVVYNEERDTLGRRFPALVNRAIIVKINRLFRL